MVSPSRGQSFLVGTKRPGVDFVNQTKLFGEASSVGQSVQVEDNAVQIGLLLGVPDIQQIKAQVALVAVWVRKT